MAGRREATAGASARIRTWNSGFVDPRDDPFHHGSRRRPRAARRVGEGERTAPRAERAGGDRLLAGVPSGSRTHLRRVAAGGVPRTPARDGAPPRARTWNAGSARPSDSAFTREASAPSLRLGRMESAREGAEAPVRVDGFEPPASPTRTGRSPSLSYTRRVYASRRTRRRRSAGPCGRIRTAGLPDPNGALLQPELHTEDLSRARRRSSAMKKRSRAPRHSRHDSNVDFRLRKPA